LIVSRLKFLVGMDIYLDAFPVSGFVELADALWCGIPVISMVEDQSSHVSAAIMTAAGYPEWIAHDTDAYIDLAVSTASAVTDTPDWRQTMHRKVKESMLFQPDSWKQAHCKLLHGLVQKIRKEKR
jgi:protein O-GlcNAc transferase